MERIVTTNSKNLTEKKEGQMIILAGFFVGIAIIALTILLNQIVLSGYQVSKSELDDTKYDLSSLRAETIRAIRRAAYDSWKQYEEAEGTANLSKVKSAFDLYMANFSTQIPGIYRQYGKIVNVSNFNILSNDSESYITNVSFDMIYTDGVNSYSANVILENIRLTAGVYGSGEGTHLRRVILAFLDPMVVNSTGGIYSVTNLTVRITDEIGNPIPGDGYTVNFTLLEDPPGVKHGYLSLFPTPGFPLPDPWNTTPDGNGQINIFFIHNCGRNDARPRHAILVETEPNIDPFDGSIVPPVYVTIMGSNPALVAPTVNAWSGGSFNEGGTTTISFSFTDPDPGEIYNATVDYGDGTDETILYVLRGNTYTRNHVYADNDTYTVTVNVTDSNFLTGYAYVTVNINNLAPVVTALIDQSAINGAPTLFDLGSLSDQGVNDNPWAVDVDWGDLSPHTNFNMDVQGPITDQSHTYTAVGPYTVTVTVTDKDGASGSNTFQVIVS